MGGRIGRSTFWLLVVAVLLLDFAVVALVSDWIRTQYLEAGIPHRPGGDVIGAGFALLVVAIVSAWAVAGVMVKRAHDLERSGWWLLIGLIPIYGLARLIVELGFLPGSYRRNAFGKSAGFVGSQQPWEFDRPAASVLETAEPAQASLFDPPPLSDPADQPAPSEDAEPVPTAALDNSSTAAPMDHAVPDDHEPADKPELIHPFMLWGKTYRADLNWPEFHPPASTGEEIAALRAADAPVAWAAEPALPETPAPAPLAFDPDPAHWEDLALAHEPADVAEATEDPEEPAIALEHEIAPEDVVEQPLKPVHGAVTAWTPAPAHDSYGDLEAFAPEPANDAELARYPR